jgi:ribosomal protein S7
MLLNRIEEDSKKLESIDKLQQAFQEVRQSYRSEYQESLDHVLGNIKSKMMQNQSMIDAVTIYVEKYVAPDKRDAASEELYNMLAAEMLQTMQAIQHTSCTLM